MTDIAEIMARAILPRVHEMYDAEIAAQAVLTALQERGFVVVKQADLERINAKSDAILAAMLAASPGSGPIVSVRRPRSDRDEPEPSER